MSELTIIVLVVGSYAATNMDNLTLVVSWMLAGKTSAAGLASGYALASLAVLVIAILLGLSSSVIPVKLIGLLGVIPAGLGIYSLIGQFRGAGEATAAHSGSSAALAIAATLTANSVDSIIIFAPMLADTRASIDPFIAVAFLGAAGAWYWLARVASHHVARLKTVTKAAGWIAPLIMIYVGVYILMNTATDVV